MASASDTPDAETPSTEISQAPPAVPDRAQWPVLAVASGLVSLAIFIFLSFQSEITSDTLALVGAPDAGRLWFGAWWGLVTSSFVHIEIVHLALNLSWVWTLGILLERRVGHGTWLALLVGASIAASGAQLAVSGTTGIGMSGVVYAWAGFCWAVQHVEPALGEAVRRQQRLLIGWLVLCVVITQAGMMNIGNAAHVGGLIFGAVAGHAWEGSRRGVARATLALMLVASIVPAVWAPWSGRWWYERAHRAWKRQDPVAAREAFDIALARDSQLLEARLMRGMLRSSEGDLAGAEDDISSYLAKVDAFPPAFDARANVRMRRGQFAGAFRDYEAGLKREKRFEGLVGQGWARHRLGHDDGALRDFEAAFPLAQTNGQRAQALQLHLELAADQDRSAEGLARCETLLAPRPDDLLLLLHRAALRELAGDAGGAAADRRRAIEKAGTDAEGLAVRIEARDALGDSAGALADADRLIALDPRGAGLRFRGSIRFRSGDLAGAGADYAQVTGHSPTDHWAWTMRGVIDAARGDFEAGRRSAEKASALDASSPYAAIWCAAFGGRVTPLEPHAGVHAWSARLAVFWQGGLPPQELVAESARTTSTWRARERACEAHAFAGIDAERRGDRAAAREHYRKSVDTGVIDFVEYSFAKARLASADLR
jgi:membrane associated rhomboid family serine protease/tetratricopeptide (TPR) repeat protein